MLVAQARLRRGVRPADQPCAAAGYGAPVPAARAAPRGSGLCGRRVRAAPDADARSGDCGRRCRLRRVWRCSRSARRWLPGVTCRPGTGRSAAIRWCRRPRRGATPRSLCQPSDSPRSARWGSAAATSTPPERHHTARALCAGRQLPNPRELASIPTDLQRSCRRHQHDPVQPPPHAATRRAGGACARNQSL